MRIEKILQEFGLGKNKASVYIATLQIGSGSAVKIAQKANLPRTTTHEILQQLVQMGLTSFVTIGRARIYSAEKPTKLKSILQEKERRLEIILPELLTLYNTSANHPEVRRYDGVEGIKTVIEDTLTVSDKKLYGILSMKDLYDVPGKEYMQDYLERRIEIGIKLFVIRSLQKEIEEVWNTSQRELRELRYANGDLLFPMTIYLYDSKIAVIGNKNETFGMIIESMDFYKTLKNLFDVLWQVSKVGKRID